jgi:hypothetical protein
MLWERQDGFVPDVVAVDYADILAPDKDTEKFDFRNQSNITWQRLRSLSQERHCLVLTATQAAASAYGKETLAMSDFSEDKRKFAHVTSMFGLNRTSREKALGIMRMNQLTLRDSFSDESNFVTVLQCLERGRPIIGSF